MITHRYFTKLLFALLIFLTSTGIYQSTAYSFFNPLKFIKGNLAELNGDKAYEDKNYPAAFAEYKKAADAGSPYGQFMLANMHLAGKSVDKDLEQYMYWLGQAADNEYPPANYLLGMAYLYSDKSLAVGYLKAAANKEHGSAMHMLGMMYAKGVGVSKNKDEAVRWFRLAKAQGVLVSHQLLTESGIDSSLNQSGTVKKSDHLIQDIQQRLINLGYNPGAADGLYGKKTRNAIIAFQQKNDLEPDGLATVRLLEALNNLSQ